MPLRPHTVTYFGVICITVHQLMLPGLNSVSRAGDQAQSCKCGDSSKWPESRLWSESRFEFKDGEGTRGKMSLEVTSGVRPHVFCFTLLRERLMRKVR